MSRNQPVPETRYADLLRLPEALRNEKALFVLIATGLLAGVSIFLVYGLAAPGAFVSDVLLGFVFLLLLPAGMSAAGLLLMDQAKGQEPRPLGKAVPDGVFAALRLLAIFLAGVAAMAIFFLLLVLLLFVCKIPFLGPALYAVLFPILTVAAGLLLLGLCAAYSMAGPAVWNGATVSEALSALAQIAARRSVELLASLFLLAALTALANFVLFGVIAVGSQIVLGASASVLGDGMAGFSAPGIIAAIAGNEYTQAAIFGFMLVAALVFTIIAALVSMGLNLIYLRIAGDLVPAHASPAKKQELAHPPAETHPAAPANKPAANSAPDILAGLFAEAAPPPALCPHCRATVQPGDRFCGECGGKVQN